MLIINVKASQILKHKFDKPSAKSISRKSLIILIKGAK